MTKPKPLALSREQLALIQQGAKGLPPGWHDRFVDAVADELLLLDNVTDADVNHVVIPALTMSDRHGLSVIKVFETASSAN